MDPDRDRIERDRSDSLHKSALDVFPGGVSHNTRYAEPHPIYVEGTDRSKIYDIDGYEYVDFWNDHGASLLGHAHPRVVEAVREQAERGLHYGTPNEAALELGGEIRRYVPSAERVRFCCSGTEATMYAVRLARAHTGRQRVLKVEGAWHGGNTDLAHSVHAPFDAPTTAGISPPVGEHVHAARLNDPESVANLIDEYPDEIAAVIVDPRKGGIPPKDAFLEFLVDAREDAEFCLIFDEVVTRFRVSPGSYQARVGVAPDLTALEKVLGGGLPVGALAGSTELFEAARPDVVVDPEERVLVGGGTFSMNPMTSIAGLATLRIIEEEPVYRRTEQLGKRIRDGLNELFEDAGINAVALGLNSLFQPVFEPEAELLSPGDIKTATDAAVLRTFHRRMLDRGDYFNRGSIGNVSYAHSEAEIDAFLEASSDTMTEMRDDGII